MLWGAAVEEQKDNRGVARGPACLGGRGAGLQQLRQRQAAKRQRSRLQKLAARAAVALPLPRSIMDEVQHVSPPRPRRKSVAFRSAKGRSAQRRSFAERKTTQK